MHWAKKKVCTAAAAAAKMACAIKEPKCDGIQRCIVTLAKGGARADHIYDVNARGEGATAAAAPAVSEFRV